MTSKQRVATAMNLGTPDRVPVMSQLSLGHYFLHSGVKPLDIWYTSDGFAQALVRMRERYQFDGILVNLPGRDPGYERQIKTLEPGDGEAIIRWKNGDYTVFPITPTTTWPTGRAPSRRFKRLSPSICTMSSRGTSPGSPIRSGGTSIVRPGRSKTIFRRTTWTRSSGCSRRLGRKSRSTRRCFPPGRSFWSS